MKKILVVLTLAVILSGCVSVTPTPPEERFNDYMDSWLMVHSSVLVEKFGTPSSTLPHGDGEKILIYDDPFVMDPPKKKFPTEYSDTLSGPPKDVIGHGRKMFYVNKEGRIYFWKSSAER